MNGNLRVIMSIQCETYSISILCYCAQYIFFGMLHKDRIMHINIIIGVPLEINKNDDHMQLRQDMGSQNLGMIINFQRFLDSNQCFHGSKVFVCVTDILIYHDNNVCTG